MGIQRVYVAVLLSLALWQARCSTDDSGRIRRAKAAIATFEQLIKQYTIEKHILDPPSASRDLPDRINPELHLDPWGSPYRYLCPGVKQPHWIDVWSVGRNVHDEADDIGNWDATPINRMER